MRLADRRYIQTTILAWLVVYGLLLARRVPPELQRGTDKITLAFGVLLLAGVAAMLTAVVIAIPLRIVMNASLKDRRRSHRSETIVLALLLLLIVAYVFEVQRGRRRLAPPPGVATLPAFADALPPPRELEVVHVDGQEYIKWTGDFSGPCDLVSGPSCYVFNRKGDLVDWQPETGDGGPVEDFLRSSVRAKQITLDEALRITRSTAAEVE